MSANGQMIENMIIENILDNKLDVGQKVIARDPHWGHYAGVVRNIRDVRGDLQVDVEVLACLKHPSQVSILYADVPFRRKAYVPGSVHVFDSKHVLVIN